MVSGVGQSAKCQDISQFISQLSSSYYQSSHTVWVFVYILTDFFQVFDFSSELIFFLSIDWKPFGR